MLKWLVTALVIWVVWKLFFARPRAKPVSRVAPEAIPRVRARALLDVGPQADDQAIREAHRRKVAAVHPDRGGSAELAQELNAARDLLLREPR